MKVGRQVQVFIAALAVIPMVTGCTTTPPENPATWPEARPAQVVLQPGDELRIVYPYWPELETEQVIRPDGKLSLQLVGEVMAGGKSPAELRDDLIGLYADKLKDPEVTVIVNEYTSHRVYVGGEVQRPGVMPIQGRLTALEAVMQAGGPLKATGKLDSVVVVRVRDGQRHARTVDLAHAIENPESEPFLLEPFDVVFVPRTNIDRVNQWVDQYINKIIPNSVIWNLTYDLRDRDFDTQNDNTTFQLQAPGL